MHPSLAFLTMLAAMPAASRPSAGHAQWLVQPGDNHCALVRTSEENEGKVLRYETHPGQARGLLLIVDRALKRDLVSEMTDLRILFDDRDDRAGQIKAFGYPLIEARRRGYGLVLLPYGDVLPRIATSTSLTIKRGDKILSRLRYADGASAAKALAQCDDTILKRWGLDPSFMASLRSPPIPKANPATWVWDSDFPSGQERYRGTTVVRATVGLDGRLSDCVTLSSSGNEVLDRATCTVYVRQGRYSPALDQHGAAIAAPVIFRLDWNAALN